MEIYDYDLKKNIISINSFEIIIKDYTKLIKDNKLIYKEILELEQLLNIEVNSLLASLVEYEYLAYNNQITLNKYTTFIDNMYINNLINQLKYCLECNSNNSKLESKLRSLVNILYNIFVLNNNNNINYSNNNLHLENNNLNSNLVCDKYLQVLIENSNALEYLLKNKYNDISIPVDQLEETFVLTKCLNEYSAINNDKSVVNIITIISYLLRNIMEKKNLQRLFEANNNNHEKINKMKENISIKNTLYEKSNKLISILGIKIKELIVIKKSIEELSFLSDKNNSIKNNKYNEYNTLEQINNNKKALENKLYQYNNIANSILYSTNIIERYDAYILSISNNIISSNPKNSIIDSLNKLISLKDNKVNNSNDNNIDNVENTLNFINTESSYFKNINCNYIRIKIKEEYKNNKELFINSFNNQSVTENNTQIYNNITNTTTSIEEYNKLLYNNLIRSSIILKAIIEPSFNCNTLKDLIYYNNTKFVNLSIVSKVNNFVIDNHIILETIKTSNNENIITARSNIPYIYSLRQCNTYNCCNEHFKNYNLYSNKMTKRYNNKKHSRYSTQSRHLSRNDNLLSMYKLSKAVTYACSTSSIVNK